MLLVTGWPFWVLVVHIGPIERNLFDPFETVNVMEFKGFAAIATRRAGKKTNASEWLDCAGG